MPRRAPSKVISVKLPPPVEQRLNRAVARRRSNRSAVVRQAIEAYLAAEDSSSAGSCYELSSDLAGSLSGPVDLSSNKGRLKGYGL